jgi:hypothetical protein
MQVRPRRASPTIASATLTGLLALVLLAACGTPPHKEMDQAQGAIDAARAAGADRYAADTFAAAQRSLTLATQAVDQRDYRLALSHAIESREQAQASARLSAETQGRLRGEVERSKAEIKTLVAQATGRLSTAEKTRVSRRLVSESRQSLSAADGLVQKADAAVQAQDFSAAQAALSAAKERISQVITRLDAAMGAQKLRRRG